MIVLNYENAINEIQRIVSINRGDILQGIVDFLYANFDKYSWVGIYIVDGSDLILGSWKGVVATDHTTIPIGFGICGYAAKSGKTEVIGDVSKDNRYLSCFASTRSEIVVPIKKRGVVVGEIDIDSDIIDAFTDSDISFLEKIAEIISTEDVIK
ncbi:MAG: GAF domain-containing protein [Thermoplasmatota archaeon]